MPRKPIQRKPDGTLILTKDHIVKRTLKGRTARAKRQVASVSKAALRSAFWRLGKKYLAERRPLDIELKRLNSLIARKESRKAKVARQIENLDSVGHAVGAFETQPKIAQETSAMSVKLRAERTQLESDLRYHSESRERVLSGIEALEKRFNPKFQKTKH